MHFWKISEDMTTLPALANPAATGGTRSSRPPCVLLTSYAARLFRFIQPYPAIDMTPMLSKAKDAGSGTAVAATS